MKTALTLLAPLGMIVASMVLAELPPIAALASWVDMHDRSIAIGAGGLLALGLALFFGGLLTLLQDRGTPLGHDRAVSAQRSSRMEREPVAWRATRYRVLGAAAGSEASDEFRLRDLKAAWRSGAVWREGLWRRRLVIVGGALLAIAGGLGCGIVAGPPWVKVLLAGMLVLVLGRLAVGWWRS